MAKNNKTSSRFIEGALIGAVLGIAAGLFAQSKKGSKQMAKAGNDIKHRLAEFYKYLAPRIKKAKKMGEMEYKNFVKNAVTNYSKTKKLSAIEAKHLLMEVQKSWTHIKRGLK